MSNNNYVSTIYDTQVREVTSYPAQLADYLMQRFNIKSGDVLVDSGCGRGDFSQAFSDRGVRTIGIDGSTENFGGTFTKIGGIDLEKDILPLDDNSVDVVFSKSVLEHIHNPEHYLNEIRRVLRSGGKLIIMVPDWHSQMFIYYDDFSHVQPYTELGLYDTLRVFGFKNVSSEVFYQLPVVWKKKYVKLVCKFLQFVGGPVKKISKNKFYRFSRELMILGVGYKE